MKIWALLKGLDDDRSVTFHGFTTIEAASLAWSMSSEEAWIQELDTDEEIEVSAEGFIGFDEPLEDAE